MTHVPANRSHMVLIHWKPLNGLIDADYGELNTYTQIIDFGELPVFPEAATFPAIF